MKLLYRILSLFAFLSITSCDKNFLDKPSPTGMVEENFWANSDDVKYALAGCYDGMQQMQLWQGSLWTGYPSIFLHEFLSDNAIEKNWAFLGFQSFYNGSLSPSTDRPITGFYSCNYIGIVRCNYFLKHIGTVPDVDDETWKKYKAEVLFLRSLFYFNLINTFGDVPLVLNYTSLDDRYVAKSSRAQIVQAMIDDLNYAVETLPASYSADEYGHATKGAAAAILAKYYLYDGKWEQAAAAAKAVIDLHQYNLESDFEYLFSEAGETSQEVVFAARFIANSGQNNSEWFSQIWATNPPLDFIFISNSLVNSFYCTDGKPIATSPLYKANAPWENRDPRLGATLWPPQPGVIGSENINTSDRWAIKKYIDHGVYGNWYNGGRDFYIMRYADVLLMRAEALIESGNTSQEVYDLIDAVRVRSHMPKIENAEGTGRSQAQLREILRHERRVEFAFESTRYYDLKRWKIIGEKYNEIKDESPRVWAEKYYYWPIPQVEIDVNSLLEQNPLWK